MNMQRLTGHGTHCVEGDKPFYDRPLSWYCFKAQKTSEQKHMVWGSPNVDYNHLDACPGGPLPGYHFGQWNGELCQPMALAAFKKVKSAEECGSALFDASSSDYPRTSEGRREWGDIGTDFVGTLFPTSGDSPHTAAFGINYANFYSNGDCHLFDTPPDCLVESGDDEYAYTSIGSIMRNEPDLPPCMDLTEGKKVYGDCDENGIRIVKECKDNNWIEYEESCSKSQPDFARNNFSTSSSSDRARHWLFAGKTTSHEGRRKTRCCLSLNDTCFVKNSARYAGDLGPSDRLNPWIIAGPILGVVLLGLLGGLGWYYVKRQ